MPSINRIRVNNVKYNFGTQGYDDFSMRMYGRNFQRSKQYCYSFTYRVEAGSG